MIHHETRLGRAAALLLAAVLLAGCGKSKTSDETQIAAKVNKDEISVHQVQYALQRQPRLAAAQPQTAARRVLDSLIEQELAAQAARSEGLETDPAVVQAMEAAKREVLARAYQDRLAAKAVSASTDEVDRYYNSKPALFNERRLYTLQEFTMDVAEGDPPRIQAALDAVKSVSELGEALSKAGLRYRSRQFVQAAEDMPMAVLETLAKLPVGQPVMTLQPGSAHVLVILQAQAAPMKRNAAGAAIEAYLLGERKRELVVREMKVLRERAQIVYQGTFAQAAAGASAAASAAN
ncbi:MAG: EpsD family peptidyl-prolyl cis-trans isomerase [Burkholderiales bacterium]